MKNIFALLAILFLGFGTLAQLDRSVPPKPQPAPPIELNIPEPIVFDNGLKVIVVENHKLPVVSFQLYSDYPIAPEGNKVGLREIFGGMLSAGTTTTPKDEFDLQIDNIGATLSTSSRGFYASSLKKHTPVLLDLVSQMILQPAFPQDEFDRLIKQTKSGLASSKNDASSISANVSNVVNYGSDHPYGEVTTEETIGAITLDDVKAFYKNNFIPNNSYLVIVGDVNQEEAKEYATKYFSSWKKGTESRKMAFDVPKSEGNNVYFSARPGAVQSVISITHPVNIKPGHKDEITLRVLNQILGGGSFSARLMSNLREDKAYTYGCYSSINSDQLIGEFSAGGSFRNEVSDSAIVQILMEINKIVDEEVLDSELDLVKNSMTGAFARSLESPQTVARFALNTVRYNLPKDYYSNYLQKLEKVSKQDLLMAAATYLNPNNLNIVVVGNEEILENLIQFDSDGQISMKDHYGQDAIALKQAPEGVTAETIVNGYVLKYMAVSSKEEMDAKLAKIGFIQVTAKAFVEAMGAELTAIDYRGAPNKSASVMRVASPQGNMDVQKEYFNGEKGGTFVMGAGKTAYEGEELENKKKPNFPISQVYYFSDDAIQVELLGIDEIDGKEFYKLKVTEEGDEGIKFEYYGVESGLLEYTEAIVTDEEGNTVTSLIQFTDYKMIKKGLFMPHKMIINAGDQVLEFETISVVVKKKPKSPVFDGTFN